MVTIWRNLLIKAVLWFIIEAILNLAGLDTLADYSEFVFEHPPKLIFRSLS